MSYSHEIEEIKEIDDWYDIKVLNVEGANYTLKELDISSISLIIV